ncbi:MAG: hypothetical protein FJ087_11105, partial [Deltaproteobacteria bacterium]|nr:hypothetical protein [Deltaproteobacteria bacterium]
THEPEPVPDQEPEPVPDSAPHETWDDSTQPPDSPPPSPAAFRVTTAAIRQPAICFPGADPCMDVTSTADAWLTGAIAPPDLSTALLLRFSPLDPADPGAFLEVGAGSCGWSSGECAFDAAQVPALFPGPLFPGLDPCEPGVPATCFVTERRNMDVWFGDLFLAFRDGHLAGTLVPAGGAIAHGVLDAMIPVNTAKSIQVSAGGAGTWKLSDFLAFAPVETIEGVKGYRFRIAYEAVEVGFAVP